MKITAAFTEALERAIAGMADLVELSAEQDADELGQLAAREELLRTTLDLLHVASWGYPPSTFALNQNPGFLLEALSTVPESTVLRCMAVVGDEHEAFTEVFRHKLLPRCQASDFDLEDAAALFFMVGSGVPISADFMLEVQGMTHSGFSVSDATALFGALASGEAPRFPKRSHAGFLVEPALEHRLRVSVWALFPATSRTPH